MKTLAQLQESIHRFATGFWGRAAIDRPPVGIVPQDIWTPIRYLRGQFAGERLSSQQVSSDLAASDYEYAFAKKTVSCDDFIPFCAPWRAVPWLEAMCGCPVRHSSGSLAPMPVADSADALCRSDLALKVDWFECMLGQIRGLDSALPQDCWISPTILRGPSDVLAAMRGISDFYCDLIDSPAAIDKAAARVNALLMDAVDAHFAEVRPKMGGYAHIFGYWAPDKTIVIQEDVMGLCSPAHYSEIFQKYDAQVAEHLGPCVMFHLHSTGYAHYRDVLRIPGIAGLQITVERNGPPLVDMLGDLRTILEQSRLVLYVEHYFDQLPHVVKRLARNGLYLILPDSFIANDRQFAELTRQLWGG